MIHIMLKSEYCFTAIFVSYLAFFIDSPQIYRPHTFYVHTKDDGNLSAQLFKALHKGWYSNRFDAE